MPDQTNNAVRRFLGAALMAVGALIAALGGACTLYFLGAGLMHASPGQLIVALPMVLLSGVVGGVPIMFGVGIYTAGRLLRPKLPPSVPPPG